MPKSSISSHPSSTKSYPHSTVIFSFNFHELNFQLASGHNDSKFQSKFTTILASNAAATRKLARAGLQPVTAYENHAVITFL